MTKLIAHRGNLIGPSPRENEPAYIDEALAAGFEVEIDLWISDGKIYLGHDYPMYEIDNLWLVMRSKNLWVHAKSIAAAEFLACCVSKWFFHDHDEMTLTSNGMFWMGSPSWSTPKYSYLGVTVILNPFEEIPPYTWGICTDYPQVYADSISEQVIDSGKTIPN